MLHVHWISPLLVAVLALPAQAEPLVLRNSHLTVEVEPSTLAITAILAGGPRIVAPDAGHAHRVSDLRYVTDGAAWEWDEGAWQVQLRLRGRDLLLWTRMGEGGCATLRRLSAMAAELPFLLPTDDACDTAWDAPTAFLRSGPLDHVEVAALHPWVHGRAEPLHGPLAPGLTSGEGFR